MASLTRSGGANRQGEKGGQLSEFNLTAIRILNEVNVPVAGGVCA
ncbi:hypothetical protein [Vibrio salinus]|nr:hypothetical protein [Vibrio salinus]